MPNKGEAPPQIKVNTYRQWQRYLLQSKYEMEGAIPESFCSLYRSSSTTFALFVKCVTFSSRSNITMCPCLNVRLLERRYI